MTEFDIVIIGGGAAGLSAALVLSRARRRVLVVDAGSPRNAPAAQLQGYLSRDGLPPADLLAAGRAEVRHYGGVIVDGAVRRAARSDLGFTVLLNDDRAVSTRRLLVATGLRDEIPDLPGLRDRWARDVLHCPYCHGWEVRDLALGVLWHGAETVRYAQIVRQWSDDVTLFAPPHTLSVEQRTILAARSIVVVEGTPRGLDVRGDRLRGVHLSDGRHVARDVIFVPPRFVPNNDLLVGLGCALDDQGWVVTGAFGSTSVAGVWVAGNVSNPRAQVITAAGEGSAAAIAINTDLVEEDVRSAAADDPPSRLARPRASHSIHAHAADGAPDE